MNKSIPRRLHSQSVTLGRMEIRTRHWQNVEEEQTLVHIERDREDL